MAQQFPALNESHQQFIEAQKIFFVGTAMEGGRVNVSPKGMESLVVMGSDRVIWLNTTGSGNESAAHVQQQPRMTLMFCAFEGNPLILRLYGTARVIHTRDEEWDGLIGFFKPLPGARQIFDVKLEMVQSSCGWSIPFFDYVAEREQLNEWADGKGEEGIRQYWAQKNQTSIDGAPSNILEKSWTL